MGSLWSGDQCIEGNQSENSSGEVSSGASVGKRELCRGDISAGVTIPDKIISIVTMVMSCDQAIYPQNKFPGRIKYYLEYDHWKIYVLTH